MKTNFTTSECLEAANKALLDAKHHLAMRHPWDFRLAMAAVRVWSNRTVYAQAHGGISDYEFEAVESWVEALA